MKIMLKYFIYLSLYYTFRAFKKYKCHTQNQNVNNLTGFFAIFGLFLITFKGATRKIEKRVKIIQAHILHEKVCPDKKIKKHTVKPIHSSFHSESLMLDVRLSQNFKEIIVIFDFH